MSQAVQHDRDGSQFVISVDGEAVGKAEYRDVDGRRIFFHTEVDPSQSGKGLAGELVSAALDETVSQGMRIVPVCPYVAKHTQRHDTWSDHVDPVTDAVKEFITSSSRTT